MWQWLLKIITHVWKNVAVIIQNNHSYLKNVTVIIQNNHSWLTKMTGKKERKNEKNVIIIHFERPYIWGVSMWWTDGWHHFGSPIFLRLVTWTVFGGASAAYAGIITIIFFNHGSSFWTIAIFPSFFLAINDIILYPWNQKSEHVARRTHKH